MPKIPLTPQQKQHEQLRKQLKMSHNRVTSAFSFHEISTWEGVFEKMGYVQDYINQKPELYSKKGTITFPELKAFLQTQTDELERQIKDVQLAPAITTVNTVETVQNPAIPSTNPAIPSTNGNTNNICRNDNVSNDTKEEKIPDSWYGLHKSPNEKANLYWHQKKATAECWQKIVKEHRRSVLILSGTGTGKTWMAGALVRRLEDIQYHENKTWSHIPYLYVTRSTIVEQTERVLKRDFDLTVEQMEVINIEQLRSKAGQYWVKEELYIEGGEEKTRWKWKKNINPCVILWDECQALKNESSTQHQIAVSFDEIEKNTVQVFMSATPFTKVIEAKCFAISTRKSLEFINGQRTAFPAGAILNENTWPMYAQIIAGPQSKPDEYNEAAVERLMSDLEDYVVRVKGVRPQFEAENNVLQIDFDTPESRNRYEQAYEKYLREKAKIDAAKAVGDSVGGSGIGILVEFLKFRMAAEAERALWLSRHMHKSVQDGKAAVCAVSFKNTIIHIVKNLIEQYGVPRDQISIIWGGGQTQLTAKQKAKKKIQEISAKLESQGMSSDDLLEQLDLAEVEDRELIDIPEEYRLGMQDFAERQREIDKFQSGKSLYCLYTLRAGGVGLSLHHTDEMTKFKCRRKDSGYAVEEDIPLVPVRQREVYIAPTWSPIEFVQSIGRVPRLTSLSPTKQTLVFYRGTIEQRVADIASRGLRCLGKIVRSRESWMDMVVNNREEELKEYMDKLPEDNNNSGLIDESPEEGE